MINNIANTIFIFDVDSTLVRSETLEDIIEIAVSGSINQKEIIRRVKKITRLGMEGELDFQESLEKRLKLVQILQKHIDLYNNKFLPKHIDCKFRAIIKNIEEGGGKVFIVSGGFRDNVTVVARKLRVSQKNCFANKFIIEEGKVVGFDKDNYLSIADGKVKIAKKIREKYNNKRVICIGDGNSDYLIKKEGVADEFWGFWGNVRRESIEKKANKNFYSSEELLEFVKNGF